MKAWLKAWLEAMWNISLIILVVSAIAAILIGVIIVVHTPEPQPDYDLAPAIAKQLPDPPPGYTKQVTELPPGYTIIAYKHKFQVIFEDGNISVETYDTYADAEQFAQAFYRWQKNIKEM